jgi:pimeloyl-ACP methyl ester carboxylesterase
MHDPDPVAALASPLAALEILPIVNALPLPQTHYAQSDEVNIAYQVFGEGPFDLVVTPGSVSDVDLMWDDTLMASFYRRLAAFARVVTFDKRDTGLSDRVADIPQLDQRVDDLRAVMDAAGVERAALMGVSEGGPMNVQFAANYPDRTRALVLYGSGARTMWAPDYPWGTTATEQDRRDELTLSFWGSDATFAPSKVNDQQFIAWSARYCRASASPAAAVALQRMNRSIDIRPLLGELRVPTLIVHLTVCRCDCSRRRPCRTAR